MPLSVPPAVNYPSSLYAVPSRSQDEPVNGRQQIAAEIDWVTMGGSRNCVSFNVQSNSTLNFEQISMIMVDNSQCAADVVFIWPDTGMTTTIPAGLPYALISPLTNALNFFVTSTNALLGDVTRFILLNYATEPSDLPTTSETQPTSSAGTVITQAAGATIQLVPVATLTGTLEDVQVSVSVPNAPTANLQFVFTITDGNAKQLVSMNVAFATGVTQALVSIMNMQDLQWRFQKGVQLVVTPAGGTGSAILNTFASYKQP